MTKRTFTERMMGKKWAQERVDYANSPVSITVEPDYRAKYAELRARVRDVMDDINARPLVVTPEVAARRLYELVGPWPHERGQG